MHAPNFTQTLTHIHTCCDTQLLANQMSQNTSPRGQTADLGSSAEFICQLEIAHGARENTHKHKLSHWGGGEGPVGFVSTTPRQTVNDIKMM